MLRRFVLFYGTQTVWDGCNRQLIRIESLRLHAKRLTDVWLEHDERRTILKDNLVFDPTCQNDPETTVNLFDGYPIKPDGSKSCALIVQHLSNMCGNDEKLFDWVCKWLAYPLQHPGAKMHTAVVIHGRREGTGKSYFFDVMRTIYGRYAKTISQLQLQSEFTGWLSQMLFCIAEEIVTQQDRKHHKGLIKNIITNPVVQSNEKMMPLREEKNFDTFVFLSNELQPLALDEFDRRFTVIY